MRRLLLLIGLAGATLAGCGEEEEEQIRWTCDCYDDPANPVPIYEVCTGIDEPRPTCDVPECGDCECDSTASAAGC